MIEHPNVTLVRNLFDAFQKSDAVRVFALIDENAVWHFPGQKGQLAGDHKGREAIFAFLAKIPALSEGTFNTELTDVLANHKSAVAIFRGKGQRNGIELDNPTCLYMRIENEKITEFREFVWDMYKVDEFWA